MIMKGDYVTPESGTFFTHEQGRSLTEAGFDIVCFSCTAMSVVSGYLAYFLRP